MLNTLNIEAITCTVRSGSYTQDTFLKKTETCWISNRFAKIVLFSYYRRKTRVLEEIGFKMKKGYFLGDLMLWWLVTHNARVKIDF